MSVDALAKKHKVDVGYIEKQLKQGIKIEHEHTSLLNVARQIALVHIGEDPDYYKKLKKVEKKEGPAEAITITQTYPAKIIFMPSHSTR